MWNLIKKYWDIFGGFIIGIALTLVARFQLTIIQLISSIIVLVLVCIGICRTIRISAENKKPKEKKKRNKRKELTIDKVVDARQEMKAISIAQNPLQQGEELYETLQKNRKDIKKIMKKIKKFFDKFKGYMLTIALGIITLVAQYGGFVEDLFNGKLVVKGVNIISLITLVCAIVVGLLSNTYTKDQMLKIKDLFKKSTTNEIVIDEIKKQVKANSTQLASDEKLLENKNVELDNLQKDLEQAKNTYNAKVEMLNMTPQLATENDVREALDKVNNITSKVEAKKKEIVDLETKIGSLTAVIAALKSRLE